MPVALHNVTECGDADWNYSDIIDLLKAGEYAAFVSGDTQLVRRAYEDTSCSLHVLDEDLGSFHHAIAFRRGLRSDALREDMEGVLLAMQENGTLSVRAPASEPAVHIDIVPVRSTHGI